MFATFRIAAAFLVMSALGASSAWAADPYNIDVILPMTGQGAFIGQSEWATIKSVEQSTNQTGGIRGRPVQFVLHDDTSNPATAAQLMADVVSRKPAVVLGSTLSALCQAMAPLAKDGPVEYCYSPAIHPVAGSFVFSANYTTDSAAITFFRYWRGQNWKRVALMFSTDASGQDAERAFDAQAASPENRDGVTIVANEHFNIADLSVAAQMARIKSANPQAILLYAVGTPFVTLLRAYRDSGLEAPIFASSSVMSLSQLKLLANLLPEQTYFPGYAVLANVSKNRQAKAANDRFLAAQKAAGATPDANTLNGWDPTILVVDALRAVGPNTTAEQLRAYIANLHGYYGALGEYDFRDSSQRGLSPENMVVERWDAGKTSFYAVSDFGGRPLHH